MLIATATTMPNSIII